MRSQKKTDLLRYEAKRRPEIAALVARAGQLTDEEIEGAEVPLPWYRQALYEMRHEAWLSAAPPAVSNDDGANSREGEIARYTGETQFIKSREHVTEMEIKGGELIFLMDGGVWVTERFFTTVPPAIQNNFRVLNKSTRPDYLAAREQELLSRHGVDLPPENTLQGNTPSPLNRTSSTLRGVKINKSYD